jgi:NAD+ kinase
MNQQDPPPPRRIAVAATPGMTDAITEAKAISSFFNELGIPTFHGLFSDEDLRERVRRGEAEMLVVVGGDGTMLRAGHLCAPLGVPILGINLGRLGFLMEVRRSEWHEVLPRLLKGNYWLEKRMMLHAELWHEAELAGGWDVVNEAVIGRGEIVRPVRLTASVNDIFLTTYVADALLASTPTGSTGYALAVGGPILPPDVHNILIIPVAPHLSFDRALVLPEGSSVDITVHTAHQAVLSIDGQPPLALADGDCVRINAGEHTLQFVHFQDPGYFYRNLTSHMNQNPSSGNSR